MTGLYLLKKYNNFIKMDCELLSVGELCEE